LVKEYIQKLIAANNLSPEEANAAMMEMMSGRATDAQIGAFLTALRIKGETIDEITAMAKTMKHFCHRIKPNVTGRLVDTAGTGGDRIKTFNISTTAAFVIAGTGIKVAKHGNRSVSSLCGSADLLEQLGIPLKQNPTEVERAIEKVGIGFMFAPVFHEAMQHVTRPRKEIGIRTVFNILGPLTNPADANAQVVGVYDKELVRPIAHVLKKLGCQEAMVVHGLDGLDEISTIGKTIIAWLKENEISLLEVNPRDLGVDKVKSDCICSLPPEEGSELTFQILNGNLQDTDPRFEIVMANAAAGIIVGGLAENFKDGLEMARKAVKSGEAIKKLRGLIEHHKGDLTRITELERKYDRLSG